MDKNTIVGEWLKGNLLTAKHDPANLSITWTSYRTVLTPDTANNLTGLLRSGEFRVHEYSNPKYGNSYFVVEPTGNNFETIGSGVPELSTIPSGKCDRLVVFSGKNQGWHTVAEDSNVISVKVTSGILNFVRELT